MLALQLLQSYAESKYSCGIMLNQNRVIVVLC